MTTALNAAGEHEKYATRYTQKEVNYTPDHTGDGGHCAGCRWFSAHSEYDGCAIIQNYPLDVVATGRCDKWEAIPSAEPDPMPVLVVGEASTDVDTAAKTESTVPTEVTLEQVRSEFKRMVDGFTGALLGRKEPSLSSIKIKGNHWLITWSNNFEDRENEIFTAKAIDHYVARTAMGLVETPELWIWHGGEKTRIGQADWVARYGHFLCAAGQFDSTEKAQRAKAYYKRNAHKTAVSHGYTFPKSAFDGKCYHEFNTFEISLLPRGVEANSYTSLERIKAMPFSEAQEQYLTEVFGEDDAKQLKAAYEERGKTLEALGVQFKDYTDPAPDDATANKEAVEQVGADLKMLIPTLMSDSAEVVKMAGAMGKALKDMQTQLDSITGEVVRLQEAYDQRPKSVVRGEAEPVSEDDDLAKKAAQVAADKPLAEVLPGLYKEN